MENFEFKDMIRMEINTSRDINVDGFGKVTVLKVPRGWVYYTYHGVNGNEIATSTFVPEREKQPNYRSDDRAHTGPR